MNKGLIGILCLVFLICFIGRINAEIIHDVDNDGIPSNIDNCPLDYNPLQEDSNYNGIGDICDPTATIIITGPVIIITNSTIVQNQTSNNETNQTIPIAISQRGRQSSMINWEQYCEPNWQCSGWSECNDGIAMRKCIDTENCLFSYNKPSETTACEQHALINEVGGNNNYLLIIMIILFVILLATLIILLLNKKNLSLSS